VRVFHPASYVGGKQPAATTLTRHPMRTFVAELLAVPEGIEDFVRFPAARLQRSPGCARRRGRGR
jgi:hypothetical protein